MPDDIEVHEDRPKTRIVMENTLIALKEAHAFLDEIEIALGPTRSSAGPPPMPGARKQTLDELAVLQIQEAARLRERLKQMWERL